MPPTAQEQLQKNIADAGNVDQLFRLWRDARPEYVHFSDDGILLDELWKIQKPRIAFVLKEPNDGFHNIRGRGYGPSGSSPVFWRNINMWSYTVAQRFNGHAVSFDEAVKRKEDVVDDIAYINLKKWDQWRSVSNRRDIQGYVDRDWDFIWRQITLLEPDVLLCCATYPFIEKRLRAQHLGLGVYATGRTIIIDFYHPSGRAGYKTRFDRLNEMLNNLPSITFLSGITGGIPNRGLLLDS
jgi:hypothetical protein